MVAEDPWFYLEANGIRVIQVDEAALREKLPYRGDRAFDRIYKRCRHIVFQE